MSLHYIFWHWPKSGVDLGVYAGKLVRFQEELENQVGGYLLGETASFRSATPPWLPSAATAFSDWYGMNDSSALDRINEGAVAGNAQQPHAEIAALYGGGAGSLYGLKSTAAFASEAVTYTHWFAKPAGMTYQELYVLLSTLLAQPNTWLLRRAMVLGPSPEFCLAADRKVALPETIEALVLAMDRL